ncbi:MAG: DMT family transporter [Burkholderiales bacterium]|jgi:S-adenosylmethionine uptake transporter|nr:DMT family transporter [Burkholderiales bacterium]
MQSLWMLVAALLFAIMGACVKLAAARYSVLEIVFYRSLIGCIGIAAFVRLRGESLATRVPWMHLRRGAVGTVALSLWFFSTTVLPLGTAMTLNYSSSLFLAAFLVGAALVARRPVNWPLAATVLLGFVGVVLALRPSFAQEQALGGLAGLASGVLSAFAYWHVRELGRLGEPEWRTVFYFALSGVIIGLLGTVVTGFAAHDAVGVVLLLTVGLTATLAQLAMTRAYGYGRALLTASLQYSAIVFASILGALVFGDRLPLSGWIGIALIVGSGVLATVLSARAKAAAQAPQSLQTAAEQ